MRVRSIKLNNIKGYRGESNFENLGTGVVLILGRNGCGKSTLAQAVGLAMFGTRPEAFKGSSGTQLNGFISQGCAKGSIEVIAEMHPQRTLVFQAELTAPSPDELSPTNNVTVEVFDEVQRDDPSKVNLAAGNRLKHIAEFTKKELGLRLEAQDLYSLLLAPSQAGGLTEYLKKTTEKRKEQTEEILGLAPVRALAKRVRKLKGEQKKLQKELLDELSLVLEQTGEGSASFLRLAEDHQKSKPAFDSLEPFHVIRCSSQCRSELMPSLVEASRALAKAKNETTKAKGVRSHLEKIAGELTHIDKARQERNDAQKEVVRLREEVQKAAAGQEAGLAYQACQKEATQTQEKLTEANEVLTEAKVDLAALVEKNTALVDKIKEQAGEIEEINKSTATLETRRADLAQKLEESQAHSKECAGALKLGQGKVRQINLLREVMDAIHGMDLSRLKTNLQTLEEEANLHLLPQEAHPVVEDLGRRISKDFVDSSTVDERLLEQIQSWEKNAEDLAESLEQKSEKAKEQATKAQQAVDNLEREAKTQESSLKELKESQVSQNEGLQKLTLELGTHKASTQTRRQARDKLRETLEKLQEALKEEGREEAWLAWKASVNAARGLDAAVATLELKTQATQALVMDESQLEPLGLTLPVLDDSDGWESLEQEIESRRQVASEGIEASLSSQNEANSRRIQEAQRIRDLEQSEGEILRRLGKLRAARASEKEFAILADSVLARLPAVVATNLVSRVSLLADEFFQSLFSQPGAELQMVWDPTNYEVTLRRGDRIQPARFASGGEQMAMGIALNLAVLHYMAPQTRWLVLDEPTASLDTVNRAALRDFVEQLSTGVSHQGRQLFDQLFFISHESILFEGLGQTLNFGDSAH